MRQLTYIANVRLPTEKAHGIQISKMCEAFKRLGLQVTLIAPSRKQINPQLVGNISTYYHLRHRFLVKFIPNFDLLPLVQSGIPIGRLAYIIQNITFSLFACLTCLNRDPLLYARSKLTTILLIIFGKRPVFEAHASAQKSPTDQLIARKTSYVVCITRSIRDSWAELGASCIYAPDGVSEEFFTIDSRINARKILNLPGNGKIVIYTGNLYPGKGVDTLIKAASHLPNVKFFIVGGSIIDKNIEPLRKQVKNIHNVHILGHKPYQLMPRYLKAADILVLPNKPDRRQVNQDSSPLKLFEYLASRTPILASDVNFITEIVTAKEIWFFRAGKYKSLVTEMKKLLTENDKSIKLKVEKAFLLAKKYTWLKRAKHILEAINAN